jgi:hypothetical protein
MARLHVLPPDPVAGALWAAGRRLGMLATLLLLAALVATPRPALVVLWSVLVPLLPASFFVSPALWRGVCPLSTLNAWGNRFGPSEPLDPRTASRLAVGGIALFCLLVPARHLLFNTDGTALAAVIAGTGALAVLLGARHASRSAFCNALCPVLPIERLYGQAPLVDVRRGRCDTCTVCTPRGCIDLAERKSLRQVVGADRGASEWLDTPLGIFAAALPGFIIGYGLTPDLPVAEAPRVYAATIGGAIASGISVRTLAALRALPSSYALPVLAALSGALYYWFAAPVISASLALPDAATTVIRLTGIGLPAYWLVRSRPGRLS